MGKKEIPSSYITKEIIRLKKNLREIQNPEEVHWIKDHYGRFHGRFSGFHRTGPVPSVAALSPSALFVDEVCHTLGVKVTNAVINDQHRATSNCSLTLKRNTSYRY